MISKTATLFLVSTALASGVALAQTSPAPATSSTAPATSASAGGSGAATGSTQFMTDQAAGQFRASKFVGLDVYGSDNQKVGDINEILIDPTGNAKAVVIGVGGFLGIGEKNVAVAWSALEWKMERPAGAQTGATNTAPSGSTAPTGAAGGMNTANRTAADTTASTSAAPGAPALSTAASGTQGGATRSPAETAAYNGYPDHAVLAMSKADLQNAPTFKYYSETHSASGGATNATAPGAAAPRQ